MSAVRGRESQRAERDERFEVLIDSPLLRGLTDEQLDDLFTLATVQPIDKPGAVIIREGEAAENFYMILSGEAEVTHRGAEGSDQQFPLTILGPGAHFGETALFEGSRRTASIHAKTPMVLAMIQTRPIREDPGAYSWLAGFLLNLAREGTSRLDRLTHQTVASLGAEIAGNDRALGFHQVLIFAIASLTSYALGVGLTAVLVRLGWLSGVAQTVVCHGLALLVGAALLLLTRRTQHPRQFFGVRVTQRWRRELRDTAIAAGGLIAALTLIKLALIETVPALRGFELFEAGLFGSGPALFAFCYVASIPLQELCARGILQSSIAEAFHGRRHHEREAIVLSSAMLATLHLHVSPLFALGVFVTGLAWGTIFSRSRSLLGATVGHVLVAAWGLRLLGLGQLLAMF